MKDKCRLHFEKTPVKFLTLYRNEKKRMFFQPVKLIGKKEGQNEYALTKNNINVQQTKVISTPH